MKKQFEKAAWSLLGGLVVIGVVATYGVAVGQGPGGGGRGGGFSRIQGTVAAVSPENRAVQVNIQGQQPAWVQLPQDVQITRVAVVKATDIKEKDVIEVNGRPTGIVAESAQVRADQPAVAENDQNAQRGAPRIGARASVTGTVVQLPSFDPAAPKPMKISIAENVTIDVTVDKDTKLSKRTRVGVEALVKGESIMAFGSPGPNNVVQARFAMAGEIQEMIDRFGGGDRGGRGGRGQ